MECRRHRYCPVGRNRRFGNSVMICDESELMLHALIDGELDAGHARDVEAHLASCGGCSEKFAAFRIMHEVMGAGSLKETAPAHLRNRIETLVGASPSRVV